MILLFSVFLSRGLIFTTNELEIKSWYNEESYNEPDYSGMKDLNGYPSNEREFLDKVYMEFRISGKKIYNRHIPGNASSPYIDGININRYMENLWYSMRTGASMISLKKDKGPGACWRDQTASYDWDIASFSAFCQKIWKGILKKFSQREYFKNENISYYANRVPITCLTFRLKILLSIQFSENFSH